MSVISYLISDLKTMKPERINNTSVGCRHTFILHTGLTIPIPSSLPPPPPTILTHGIIKTPYKNSLSHCNEIIKS